MKITHEEMVAAFGSAEEVHAELEQMRRDTDVLSNRWKELVELYDGKWVAAHDGEIAGVADTHEDLFAQLKDRGIARSSAVVRHVERNPAILIL